VDPEGRLKVLMEGVVLMAKHNLALSRDISRKQSQAQEAVEASEWLCALRRRELSALLAAALEPSS
jgi:hypothetical protein